MQTDRQILPTIFVIAWLAVIGTLFFRANSQPPDKRMLWLTRLNAHPVPYAYGDLKLAIAAVECERAGYDAYEHCPIEATAFGLDNVPVNYPRTVLEIGRIVPFHFTVSDGDHLGPVFALAFLITVGTLLLIQPPTTWTHTLYLCALAASPPIFLSLERTNFDTTILSSILITLLLIDRFAQPLSFAFTFVLGTLKLYPIAAIAALLRPARNSRRLFSVAVAAEGVFILASRDNLRQISRLIVKTTWQTFGFPEFFLYIAHRAPSLMWISRLIAPCLVLLIAALAWNTWRNRQSWGAILASGSPRYRSLFLAGASIYSFCYCVGINFNYRLTFLLLTVPFLLSIHTRIARAARVAILCIFWLTAIDHNPAISIAQATLTLALCLFLAPLVLTALCESFGLKPTTFRHRNGNAAPETAGTSPP